METFVSLFSVLDRTTVWESSIDPELNNRTNQKVPARVYRLLHHYRTQHISLLSIYTSYFASPSSS